MTPDVKTLVDFERERERLRREIAQLPDMRQGSLTPVYRRCGKPTCHCAREEDPGHGPLFLLTRSVKKKTIARSIPPQDVETAREQVAVFHHYQELSRELVNVSGQICDLKLRDAHPDSSSSDAVKKNIRTRPRS